MIKILKNKIIIILLLILCVILGLIFFLRPKTTPNQTDNHPTLPVINVDKKDLLAKPTLDKITDKIQNLPDNADVYQITPASISHQQAIDIAVKLGFSGSPQISQDPVGGAVYVWENKQNYFAVTTQKGSFVYGLNLLSSNKLIEDKLASDEEITKAAKSFLNNNIIPTPQNVAIEFQSIDLLKTNGTLFEKTNSPQNANVAQINFNFKLNGVIICDQYGNESLLKILIGPGMKIVKIDYQMPFLAVSQTTNYPLIDKNNLLEELTKKPQIVAFTKEGGLLPDTFEYQDIKEITFTDLKVAYFIPQQSSSYLQPVILINGDGKVNNTNFTSTSIYPAIQDKYYQGNN